MPKEKEEEEEEEVEEDEGRRNGSVSKDQKNKWREVGLG
jgi:hypothetical protein